MKRSRRLLRAGSLAAALVVVGLLAAACGGGSASPGVASLGATTTTSPPAAAPAGDSGSTSQLLQYSQCMRKHGISNYPDPGPDAVAAMRKVDLSSPQYRAAMKTCLKILPNGGVPSAAPLPPKVLAEALKYTQCMRSHGVTNFPDPTSSGYVVVPQSGSSASPTVQRAAKACRGLLPEE